MCVCVPLQICFPQNQYSIDIFGEHQFQVHFLLKMASETRQRRVNKVVEAVRTEFEYVSLNESKPSVSFWQFMDS
jgi:hypothetical protein